MGSCISSIPKHPSSAKVQMSLDNNSSIPSTPIKEKPAIVDPPIISSALKSRVSPLNSVSSYRSHGSREETFYDTQRWLESDNEEDFYSVNGDFTPSRGSTPVHSAVGTPRLHRTFSPQVNRALFEGRPPVQSGSIRSRGSTPVRRSFSSVPQLWESFSEGAAGTKPDATSVPRKKKLVDLFRESMREPGGVGLSFPGYESDSSQRIDASPSHAGLPPKPARRSSPLADIRYATSKDKRNPPDSYVLEKDKSSKFAHRCFPRLASIHIFHENKKASSLAISADELKKGTHSGRSSES